MYHKNLLNVQKTIEIIQKLKVNPKKELINLQNGNSRVLARKIEVKIDVPPFNRSAMDGYAVIADDISKASETEPIYLKVVEEIGAGDVSNHVIEFGEAIKIATGAKMPMGSDAVIMEENVEYEEGKIRIVTPIIYNNDVALKGEDLKQGELIISEGQILGPHHLSVIASAGYSEIEVYKKPQIGVIITGNELVEPSTKLTPGKIINSNKFALKGVIEDSMAVAHIKHCPDDIKKLILAVEEAVDKYDAVITTGGTAISKGDLIIDIVKDLGSVPIHGVSIKPGKPFGFGIIKQTPVFMLSGYPVAVAVQYDIFVRNPILKMQKITKEFKFITAIAGKDIKSSPDKYNVIRADLKDDTGVVYPIRTKAGINKSILLSNCYIIAEEGIGKIKKDEKCNILKFGALKIC